MYYTRSNKCTIPVATSELTHSDQWTIPVATNVLYQPVYYTYNNQSLFLVN